MIEGSILITILVFALIFALIWYLIGLLPLPAPLAQLKWILYAILIIAAIIVLLNLVGIHLP